MTQQRDRQFEARYRRKAARPVSSRAALKDTRRSNSRRRARSLKFAIGTAAETASSASSASIAPVFPLARSFGAASASRASRLRLARKGNAAQREVQTGVRLLDEKNRKGGKSMTAPVSVTTPVSVTVSSGVAVAAKSTSTTAGDHVGVFNLAADGGTNNAGLNVVSAKTHSLCDDAKAWNKEARRRVAYYRANRCASDGDRIKILGRDVDGKTDDLAGILVEVDTEFSRINGSADLSFTARLIAPLPSDDDAEEDVLTKNGSSTILGISMTSDWVEGARYLIGGDAEVGVWERVWDRNKERKHVLEYDVLIAPHHCSWHGLSWDSWSDCGEDAEVSKDARSALGQARPGAKIIASSKPVADDDN